MSEREKFTYHNMPPEIRAEIQQDDARFKRCLAYVRAHTVGEVQGVNGPGSMAWLLFREPGILLGGLRAILLQIAHPAVAAGVEQSSDFRNDILGRARRTYTAMYELVFGTQREAIGAATRLHNIHNFVRGTVSEEGAGTWRGRTYRANDPVLLKWVWATLVDTIMLTYELLVRPLAREEKERYYKETRVGAALTGVPPEIVPATLKGFEDYFNTMLEGPELVVGDVARGQAEVLFSSPYTPRRFDELLTGGLLPPPLRDAYGLRWDEKDATEYRRLLTVLRTATRLTPSFVRAVPAYHQAHLRIALARGESPSIYARILNRIDHWVDVPLSLKPVPVER